MMSRRVSNKTDLTELNYEKLDSEDIYWLDIQTKLYSLHYDITGFNKPFTANKRRAKEKFTIALRYPSERYAV